MKLRNKNTGKIVDAYSVDSLQDCIKIFTKDRSYIFYSLKDLNGYFEDYKPPKPLIKGEKYVDLFKRWVKFNSDYFSDYEKSRKKFVYCENKDMLFYVAHNSSDAYGIGFSKFAVFKDLQDGQHYSYYDLVGEERN